MDTRARAPGSRAVPLGAALFLLALAAGCQRATQRTWPTGNPRAQGPVSRIDGREEGMWTFWFPDGQLREQGRYEGGQRVGRWRQWHSNGRVRSEGERTWEDSGHRSARTGLWSFWYENGQLEGRGVCVAGGREGHWDYFLTDGLLDGDRTGEYHLDQRLR